MLEEKRKKQLNYFKGPCIYFGCISRNLTLAKPGDFAFVLEPLCRELFQDWATVFGCTNHL